MASQKKITMRMLTIGGMSILAAAIIFSPLAAYAQSWRSATDDPFWKLMAMVPDDEVGHGEFTELTYTNYQALAEAWDVAGLTYDDVLNGTDKSALWLALTTASQNLTVEDTPAFFSGMQDTLGFTMLNVRQALYYGWPPLHGYMVVGDFDLDAIRAALGQRSFSPVEIHGIEVWCGEIGCDGGTKQDLQQKDSTNIFGGSLGRSEPIALLPELLLDSPSLDTLTGMIGVQTEQQPSLLEVSDYRAFAETITTQGTVLEAYTLNPNLIYTWEQFQFSLPLDRRDQVIASAKAFGELPIYNFVGFAHIWNNGEFYAQIILLYDDVKTAEIASQEVHTRLLNAMPMSSGSYQNYRDQYADAVNGELLPPTVVEGQGYAAAIMGWRWNEVPADVQSPYRLLRASILHQDVYYLGTSFVLPD